MHDINDVLLSQHAVHDAETVCPPRAAQSRQTGLGIKRPAPAAACILLHHRTAVLRYPTSGLHLCARTFDRTTGCAHTNAQAAVHARSARPTPGKRATAAHMHAHTHAHNAMCQQHVRWLTRCSLPCTRRVTADWGLPYADLPPWSKWLDFTGRPANAWEQKLNQMIWVGSPTNPLRQVCGCTALSREQRARSRLPVRTEMGPC